MSGIEITATATLLRLNINTPRLYKKQLLSRHIENSLKYTRTETGKHDYKTNFRLLVKWEITFPILNVYSR